MTMTELTNQLRSITGEINALSTERSRVVADIRHQGEEADNLIRAELEKALNEARTTVDELLARHAEAEAHKVSLDRRIDGGDESVTAEDVIAANITVRQIAGLLKPAEATLREAETAIAPFLADSHLAALVADVLVDHTDAPVILRKRLSDMEGISEAVVLSQVEPTSNYGTIKASGVVEVSLIGSPSVYWREVEKALADMGNDVVVESDRITFDLAAWPLPRLTEPSSHAINLFARLFEEAWRGHIENNHAALRLAEAGRITLRPGMADSGNEALVQRLDETFDYGDGTATGIARFALAVVQKYGRAEVEDIEAEARALVKMFADESVGNLTEAGEIVAIELVSCERGDGSVWDHAVKVGVTGNPMYLATAEVAVKVTYGYEAA